MSAETDDRDRIARRLASSLEPDWLREMRERAWESYETLPAPVFEKSDLAKRRTGPFPKQAVEADCPDAGWGALMAQAASDAPGRLVFANGCIVTHHLSPELVHQGVVFADLALALRTFPDLVRPHLGRVIPLETNQWIAMQTALWNAGVLLYVPANVQVEVPLQAWWHRTAGGGELHPRLLIVAEANSAVTLLIGESSRLNEDAFSVFVGEVVAGPGAQVQLASVQEQDRTMTRLTYLHAEAGRDAQVAGLYADIGTGWHMADVSAALQENGASVAMDAICLGAESQRLDLTLRAQHTGRHTRSEMRVRGLLADRSRTVTRAVSQIEKGAVGTNSTQDERLLLLSRDAQAHPIPMLLIAEEDVSCDHAVSVGRLPADQLFYLMARGLPETAAKRLLITSFLAPLYDGLLDHTLNAWVERKVPL